MCISKNKKLIAVLETLKEREKKQKKLHTKFATFDQD